MMNDAPVSSCLALWYPGNLLFWFFKLALELTLTSSTEIYIEEEVWKISALFEPFLFGDASEQDCFTLTLCK
jgi:hypothetical protein